MSIRMQYLFTLLSLGLAAMAQPAIAADARTTLHPFQAGCDISSSTDQSQGRCKLTKSVPTGKRLVIETVTGYYYGDGAMMGAAYLTINGVRHAFPWLQVGTLNSSDPASRRFYGFNHAVQLYVKGPADVQFDTDGGTSIGNSSYSGGYSVSGYLVDLPTQ